MMGIGASLASSAGLGGGLDKLDGVRGPSSPAQQLGLEIAKAQGLARITLSVLQRGIFGRLKWLLFGR